LGGGKGDRHLLPGAIPFDRQVRGDAKNKLPVWAYTKETIRKKKGLASRKTSCGWFLSLALQQNLWVKTRLVSDVKMRF